MKRRRLTGKTVNHLVGGSRIPIVRPTAKLRRSSSQMEKRELQIQSIQHPFVFCPTTQWRPSSSDWSRTVPWVSADPPQPELQPVGPPIPCRTRPLKQLLHSLPQPRRGCKEFLPADSSGPAGSPGGALGTPAAQTKLPTAQNGWNKTSAHMNQSEMDGANMKSSVIARTVCFTELLLCPATSL